MNFLSVSLSVVLNRFILLAPNKGKMITNAKIVTNNTALNGSRLCNSGKQKRKTDGNRERDRAREEEQYQSTCWASLNSGFYGDLFLFFLFPFVRVIVFTMSKTDNEAAEKSRNSKVWVKERERQRKQTPLFTFIHIFCDFIFRFENIIIINARNSWKTANGKVSNTNNVNIREMANEKKWNKKNIDITKMHLIANIACESICWRCHRVIVCVLLNGVAERWNGDD